jgi:RNase P subunit RPR2
MPVSRQEFRMFDSLLPVDYRGKVIARLRETGEGTGCLHCRRHAFEVHPPLTIQYRFLLSGKFPDPVYVPVVCLDCGYTQLFHYYTLLPEQTDPPDPPGPAEEE